MVPPDGDVAVFFLFEQFVLEDLFRAQGVAAMDQVHLFGEVAEVQGLFHGGVAAADDGDFPAAVKKAVTGGAGGYAFAFEGLFGFQAQVQGAGAGGDDDGVGGVAMGIALQCEGARREVDGCDEVEDDFGVEAFRVLLHALHQGRALQAFDIAGPVVYVGGGGELAAHFQAGDQHRVEVGAGRVYGGGVSGGTGSEDQQAAMLGFAHVGCAPRVTGI